VTHGRAARASSSQESRGAGSGWRGGPDCLREKGKEGSAEWVLGEAE
jgi:hypothetical protein